MSKRKQPLTNVQIVERLMTFSKFGAMSQLFIMDAIEKQAKKVANVSLEELKEAFGENPFISPEAWHGVAKEIVQRLEELRKEGH